MSTMMRAANLASLPGDAVGQASLEDRQVADSEDLVAGLFLKQPGRSRATEQVPCRGLNLAGGQPLMTRRRSPAQSTSARLTSRPSPISCASLMIQDERRADGQRSFGRRLDGWPGHPPVGLAF